MQNKETIKVIHGSSHEEMGHFALRAVEADKRSEPKIITISFDDYHSLREWQKNAVLQVKDKKNFIIQAPTGAGKSYGLCCLAYEKIKKDRALKVIFAVPQTVIAGGFTGKKFKSIEGDDVDFDPTDLCNGRTDDNSRIKSLLSHLKIQETVGAGQESQNVIVCTHATLVAAFKKNRSVFKNVLIVIDEAHHAKHHKEEADLDEDDSVYEDTEEEIEQLEETWNGLGEIVKYGLDNPNKNVQLGLTTATMFRSDAGTIVPADTKKEYFEYFFLPFDKFFASLLYLKELSFNVVFYSREYHLQINECIKSQKNFKKSFFFIPLVNSSSSSGKGKDVLKVIKGVSGKDIVKQNIDYKYLNENRKKCAKGNHIYISIRRNNQWINLVDFVEESKRNIKKEIINKSHDDEKENFIDGIIALGVFKEGASWKWAENCYIIGERNSLVELVQINGRLYRDVKGKQKVTTFYMVDTYFDTKSEENQLLEKTNKVLKAVYLSMMIEDVLLPPGKIIRKVTKKNPKTGLSEIVEEHYEPFLELAGSPDKAIKLKEKVLFDSMENVLKEVTSEEVKKGGIDTIQKIRNCVETAIRQNLKSKTEVDPQTIQDAVDVFYEMTLKRTKNCYDKQKLALNQNYLNVSDINFEIMQSTPFGLWFACSSGTIDVTTFEKLRAAVAGVVEEQVKDVEKICDFKDKNNGKNPSRNSKNPEEKRLANKLHALKKAKQGKGNGSKFYPASQEKAEERGYPDLFDMTDLVEEQVKAVEEICDFKYKNNGKNPSESSKNPEEKRLGKKLGALKQAKQGKGNRSKFYPESQKKAEERGYPDLFGLIDLVEEQVKAVEEICDFKDKNNGKNPSQSSKNPEEKRLANKLSDLKQAKQGKVSSKFYPESQKKAEERGYPDLFGLIDLVEEQVNDVENICDFKDKNNGKNPSQHSKNPEEKRLGNKLSGLKQAKQGKGKGKFYSESQEKAEERGYPDLFDILK